MKGSDKPLFAIVVNLLKKRGESLQNQKALISSVVVQSPLDLYFERKVHRNENHHQPSKNPDPEPQAGSRSHSSRESRCARSGLWPQEEPHLCFRG